MGEKKQKYLKREVKAGNRSHSKIYDVGGMMFDSKHHYQIIGINGEFTQNIKFQNGELEYFNINGALEEDYVAVLIDRLEPLEKNGHCAKAIKCLKEAFSHLRKMADKMEKKVSM